MLMLFFFMVCVQIAQSVVVYGDSLRLCRELQYDYVVSQAAIDEFGVAVGAAVNADQQLVNRYADMSTNQLASQQCLFHWKNLMCSHVFRTSDDAPACDSLCEQARIACNAEKPNFCAAPQSHKCTDYGKLTGFCAATVDVIPSPPQSPTPATTPRPTPKRSDAATNVAASVLATVIVLSIVHFFILTN